jgi:hypothetical protein
LTASWYMQGMYCCPPDPDPQEPLPRFTGNQTKFGFLES